MHTNQRLLLFGLFDLFGDIYLVSVMCCESNADPVSAGWLVLIPMSELKARRLVKVGSTEPTTTTLSIPVTGPAGSHWTRKYVYSLDSPAAEWNGVLDLFKRASACVKTAAAFSALDACIAASASAAASK